MAYKWYILPSGGLYGTYHPLREPGNSIDVLCFYPISAVIGPEELERMEREEEERRNGGTAERRLERQGHGTSFSLTWDGMVGLLIAMLDLQPTIFGAMKRPFGIGTTPDLGDLGSPWIISHVSYLACDPPSAMLLECRMLTVSSSEGQP